MPEQTPDHCRLCTLAHRHWTKLSQGSASTTDHACDCCRVDERLADCCIKETDETRDRYLGNMIVVSLHMHIYDILQGKSEMFILREKKYKITLYYERPSLIPSCGAQMDSRASTPRMPATVISSRLLISTRLIEAFYVCHPRTHIGHNLRATRQSEWCQHWIGRLFSVNAGCKTVWKSKLLRVVLLWYRR